MGQLGLKLGYMLLLRKPFVNGAADSSRSVIRVLYTFSCNRKVVDHYAACGSAVNECLLDGLGLSKAFDKMNDFALYQKLIDRSIPVQILSVSENWFSLCPDIFINILSSFVNILSF